MILITWTLGRSLKSVVLNLWDERNQKMASFGAIRGMNPRLKILNH